MEQAIRLRSRIIPPDTGAAYDALSSATGLPPEIIQTMFTGLDRLDDPEQTTAIGWGDWLLDLIRDVPAIRRYLLKSTIYQQRDVPVDVLRRCLRLWMTGRPLVEVERALGTPASKLQKLTFARRFARNMARDLSYTVGLIAQLAKSAATEPGNRIAESATTAAALIRDGFDTPEKWVLHQLKKSDQWTRVKVHQEAAERLRYVDQAPEGIERQSDLFRRVSNGIRIFDQRHPGS